MDRLLGGRKQKFGIRVITTESVHGDIRIMHHLVGMKEEVTWICGGALFRYRGHLERSAYGKENDGNGLIRRKENDAG